MAIVSMGPFPGLVNSMRGTLVLQPVGGSLYIYGLLTGLDESSEGDVAFYDGYSCAGPHRVGAVQSARSKYVADSNGVAQISLTVPGLSLNDDQPVMGRPLIIEPSGTGASAIGCGIVVPSGAQMAVVEVCRTMFTCDSPL